MTATDDVQRIRGYILREREAALLYRRLADLVDGEERATLLTLAAGEEQHAQHWRVVLERLGGSDPDHEPRLRLNGRLALALGRRFGLLGAMPVLEHHEGQEILDYESDPHSPAGIVDDEREHTELVRSLAPKWRGEVAGTLRAGVFGFSDGVVSNVALVIGVFGSGASTAAIVTAGIAGLVAGALSMATGEYVSVASQREVLEAGADASADDARPMVAAVASFFTFAFGAVVPLVPFLFLDARTAAIAALVATGALLYTLGATLSLLTLHGAVRTGMRQLLLGWGAAGATYLVGTLIGSGLA